RILVLLSTLLLISCGASNPKSAAAESGETSDPTAPPSREVRLTNLVEAVHSNKVTVPQISRQYYQFTLIHLIPNGSRVKAGDVVAKFDTTQQLEAAFTSRARYDDLSHQVDQKASQNRADAEKRRSDLTQAQAKLAKALLDV